MILHLPQSDDIKVIDLIHFFNSRGYLLVAAPELGTDHVRIVKAEDTYPSDIYPAYKDKPLTLLNWPGPQYPTKTKSSKFLG